MSHAEVLILAAMTREAKALARSLGAKRDTDGGFRAPGVQLRAVGVRGVRLGRIPKPSAETLVIVAGLGGGLDPGLRAGDVVLDDPAGLLERVLAGLAAPRVHRGAIHTAARILDGPHDKEAARRQTGAACVDMEQEIVRQWLGRPLVGVRVVLDTAQEALNPRVTSVSDEMGDVRLWALMRLLASQPGVIRQLIGLGSASGECMRGLGEVLRAITASRG